MEIQRTTAIPEIKDTIVMLRQLNADEKVRQEAYYREKRLHDEATALGHARREGIQEGMQMGIQKGMQKGMQKGTLNTLAVLVKKGMLTIPQAAEEAHMSVLEFENEIKTLM